MTICPPPAEPVRRLRGYAIPGGLRTVPAHRRSKPHALKTEMPYKLPAIPRRQLKLSRFFLRSVLKSVPAIGAILEIPDNVSTVLPAKAMIAAIAEHTVFGFWYISTDDVRRWSQRFRVDGRGIPGVCPGTLSGR